ncbi:hypothetical protein V9K67_19685 [Paraflavisolibacter sp. H34]|uniref:tetratricopeptide repeat protein n=1 Tax=Huijunlia imazamoxiresistens TaxID=3127457 RepID=UPI003018F5EB
MKPFFLFILVAAIAAGCARKQVARPEDYAPFLQPAPLGAAVHRQQQELSFWIGRLQQDTGSFVNLLEVAGNRLALFHLTGRVHHLQAGDSLVAAAARKLNNSDPAILQMLSQVSITRHRFSDAAAYNEKARRHGASPFQYHLIAFDAAMEVGRYAEAGKFLAALKDKVSFDYLIRRARYEDHQGHTDASITAMEAAFDKVKGLSQKGLYCWTLSNLADRYAHAGRIKDAYAAYLAVLQKDGAYFHALKGIAWIAWSWDHNTKEAERILRFIEGQTPAPDLYLALAGIAEDEGREQEKEQLTRRFVAAVRHPDYGDQYNKYLVDVLAPQHSDQALELAQREVQNRPTTESYLELAWALHHKGDHPKALSIYQTYVAGRTFEPDAAYKGAFILKAAGREKEAARLKERCLESAFELGPVKIKKMEEIPLPRYCVLGKVVRLKM